MSRRSTLAIGVLVTVLTAGAGWSAAVVAASTTAAASSCPTSASFSYDALGRRIDRTIAGSSVGFAYDGASAVQERVAGSPSSNQLLGGLDATIRRVDGAGTRELLTDALGSTVGLVDSGGSVTTSYTYEPYGATSTSGSGSANPAQFTGREADATGLYYYRARYYSPSLGRFISEDPAGFSAGDPNLYRYVGGDPINATDPSGEIVFVPCVAGAAIDVALTIADNWLSGRKTTLGDIAGSAVSGCVAGYVGAGLGKALKWLGERALRWLGKGEDAAGMLDDVISCAVPRSFAADTPVTTPGGTKPIADVDVGDTILAYEPATGQTQERPVTATMVHRDTKITRVMVDGETVVTTPDHPFLTEDRGWVDAGDLRPGDQLVSATGRSGAVFGVITHPGSADMWDLTVASTHTFAVGAGGWVVHNACPGDFAPGKLDSHFADHAAEWGAGNITKASYLKRARSLLSKPEGGDILGYTRPNGDILRYNVRTNEFAAARADGTIKTLFRPKDGFEYWLGLLP